MEDPALDEQWEAAQADKGYKHAAKVAGKVSVGTMKTMTRHSILEYKQWLAKTLVIKKEGTRLPMYKKMKRTTAADIIEQLKRWFVTFGVIRFLRSDHGPPFSSKAFKDFCNDFCIELHLCAP